MDLHLKDNVVVVVGAASGIGRATATEFLREGAHVCWLDKTATVRQVADEVDASQPFARVVDVTDYEATATAARTVMEQFGRCDHVVACMGMGSGKFGYPFWNLEPADWQEVVNVNLIGLALIAPATVLCAPLGAKIAHSLDRRRLSVLFGFFLLLVAARMFTQAV